MTLTLLPETYAVCRLEPGEAVPSWAAQAFCITRTREELSIVCEEVLVPPAQRAEREFRSLKVGGPLDFALTGILANLATTLAEAKVSLFALSTFDTDYLFVRQSALETASAALRRAGHEIV